MKVVIIDDSDEQRVALKAILNQRCPDCRIFEAKDGVNGLIHVGQQKPDIIFLDLCMPELNGYAVLRIIRAFDPRVYVAITSTQSLRANVQAAMQLKASAFLVKPCNPDLVSQHIGKALALSKPVDDEESAKNRSLPPSQVIVGAEA